MGTHEEHQEEEERTQREADAMGLRNAQRLAAADNDVRSALDHAWWTGLRAGLEAQLERPVRLPRSPFSSAAIEDLYPFHGVF